MDWIRVDYLKTIMMFLSTVWTLNLTAPLTAEDSLVSKWYNALNFSKSVPIKKTIQTQPKWPEGEYIFKKLFLLPLFLHLTHSLKFVFLFNT